MSQGWRVMGGDGEALWRRVRAELRAGNMVTLRTRTAAPTLIPVTDKLVRIVHGPQPPTPRRGRA